MRRFVNRLRPQAGFTLIELIASLTVFAMVAGLIGSVTMFGFRSYHKITVQNALRDEADLIMSSIITELYTYGPEQVRNTAGGIELIRAGSDPRYIRVMDGKMVIGAYADNAESSSSLAIRSDLGESGLSADRTDGQTCNPGTLCESGLIKIRLVLKYDGHDDEKMELESQFGF